MLRDSLKVGYYWTVLPSVLLCTISALPCEDATVFSSFHNQKQTSFLWYAKCRWRVKDEGGGCGAVVLEGTEQKHSVDTVSAHVSLWHNQNIIGGGWVTTAPLFRLSCFGEWYHLTAPMRYVENKKVGGGSKRCREKKGLMYFLWWCLFFFFKATHSVVAELTEVIATNEESHQLPVVGKVHCLGPKGKIEKEKKVLF